MAGVQTDAHSALVLDPLYDAPQLRELTPHRVALATHVLQH